MKNRWHVSVMLPSIYNSSDSQKVYPERIGFDESLGYYFTKKDAYQALHQFLAAALYDKGLSDCNRHIQSQIRRRNAAIVALQLRVAATEAEEEYWHKKFLDEQKINDYLSDRILDAYGYSTKPTFDKAIYRSVAEKAATCARQRLIKQRTALRKRAREVHGALAAIAEPCVEFERLRLLCKSLSETCLNITDIIPRPSVPTECDRTVSSVMSGWCDNVGGADY